jgi:hypothetical protein
MSVSGPADTAARAILGPAALIAHGAYAAALFGTAAWLAFVAESHLESEPLQPLPPGAVSELVVYGGLIGVVGLAVVVGLVMWVRQGERLPAFISDMLILGFLLLSILFVGDLDIALDILWDHYRWAAGLGALGLVCALLIAIAPRPKRKRASG